ncbi:hypothetical protein C8R45DRAFT_937199 [Mycena sanguinolenta]|nr:hypothetical protein C8R45DRAFT_937199 [Mycena sanguinolenta]
MTADKFFAVYNIVPLSQCVFKFTPYQRLALESPAVQQRRHEAKLEAQKIYRKKPLSLSRLPQTHSTPVTLFQLVVPQPTVMKPYCCEPPFYPDPGEPNQPPPNKKIFSVCGGEVEKLGGYLSWTSADAAYKFLSGATVKSFRNSATVRLKLKPHRLQRWGWLKPSHRVAGLRASSNHGLSRLQPKKDKGITNIMKEEYRYEAVRPTSSTTVLNHIYILAEPGDLTVALARTRVAGKESGQRVWLGPVQGLAVSCVESEHGRQQNRATSETPSQGSPKAHLILSSPCTSVSYFSNRLKP